MKSHPISILAWSNPGDWFPRNDRGRPPRGGTIWFEDYLDVEVPCPRIGSLNEVAAVVGTGAVFGYHEQEVLAGGVIKLPR